MVYSVNVYQESESAKILHRWKKAIIDYWTYTKPKLRKRGRHPITKAMKLLIRDMKIDNYQWGCKRIQDELAKISIDISRETVRKVIQDYRKSGEIKPNYSWSRFRPHQGINSIPEGKPSDLPSFVLAPLD